MAFDIVKIELIGEWSLNIPDALCSLCKHKLTEPCTGCSKSVIDVDIPKKIKKCESECLIVQGECGDIYHGHCILKQKYCSCNYKQWKTVHVIDRQTCTSSIKKN